MKVIFKIEDMENLDDYILEFIDIAKKQLEESSKKLISRLLGVSKIFKNISLEYDSKKRELYVNIPIDKKQVKEGYIDYVEIMKGSLENYFMLKTGKTPHIEYEIAEGN